MNMRIESPRFQLHIRSNCVLSRRPPENRICKFAQRLALRLPEARGVLRATLKRNYNNLIITRNIDAR